MKRWTLVTILLMAAACLVWIAVVQAPDGRLHVIFLDVEGGQGVLVRTPSGRVILIDGGPKASVLLTALGRYLPFWQRTLHAVIATHQGSSAIMPLFDVCQRYDVQAVLAPAAGDHPTTTYVRWRRLLDARRLPLTEVQAGAVLDMADGTQVQITADDAGQISVRLSYGETDILLPGLHPSAATPIAATVVAFPASSALSSSLAIGSNVSAVVLFTGKRGVAAPAPATTDSRVYSTAVYGTLELISDGRGIQIRPVR